VRKARNDTDFADDPLSRRDNFTGLVFITRAVRPNGNSAGWTKPHKILRWFALVT
jgi:hypothetical protein